MTAFGIFRLFFMRLRNVETDQARLALHEKCPNTGKYGPEITPHLDTFHALLFANLRMKVSSISKEI